PAAGRLCDRGDRDRAGLAIDVDDPRAGVVDAVGDQHLVTRVIVLAHGTAGGDTILLVTVEIPDAEHPVIPEPLHRGDPARFPFADDIGEELRQERRRSVLHARGPEVALVVPGAG